MRPDCERSICTEQWHRGNADENQAVVEVSDEEDNAGADERIRDAVADLGLDRDVTIGEKRPRGPQGQYTLRGGQQGISAARHQANALN